MQGQQDYEKYQNIMDIHVRESSQNTNFWWLKWLKTTIETKKVNYELLCNVKTL
jgi:hypothetical protein